MNYYPFHIGDYLSATRHLSWEEDAAYRRLLDVYYTSEKPLPAEMKQVWRLVLATTETQREAVETVLAEYFEPSPAGWINSRADAEIDAMREKQQKQRDKANAMWEKRRAAAGTSTAPEHGKAPVMPRHGSEDAAASNSDADAMPPTPTPTPTPTPKKEEKSAPPSALPKQPRDGEGTRLAKDWLLPDDWAAWCVTNRPDIDPNAVADGFRDFWISKPGKDGRKSDWLATWRNWCRAQKSAPGRPGPQSPLAGAI